MDRKSWFRTSPPAFEEWDETAGDKVTDQVRVGDEVCGHEALTWVVKNKSN